MRMQFHQCCAHASHAPACCCAVSARFTSCCLAPGPLLLRNGYNSSQQLIFPTKGEVPNSIWMAQLHAGSGGTNCILS